ncbi:MAG TPA: hypothetical protein VK574_01530 [Terracidiphilus sp.]|jgi:hypothetical protein|nr:hypothetical protein [Terracidiphilus sp.]
MELDVSGEFKNRTDEILHYIWDPIGVAGAVMARDEYSGYVPQLMMLLMANSPASTVADYLTDIRTKHMELPANRKEDEAAVQLLLQWRAKLEGKKPRILG